MLPRQFPSEDNLKVAVMTDIIIETLRMLVVGIILIVLLSNRNIKNVSTVRGWRYILAGFGLIFFGMVIDITDNFSSLDQYVIIGDTEYQAFIEKIIGYLLGFSLLAVGICKWIPGMIELESQRKKALANASSQIKILTGLLPICMDCKKIRDDTGYWNQLEKFIGEHSEAELSHSICEECMEKRYPALDGEKPAPEQS